jgi:hypothetical protein
MVKGELVPSLAAQNRRFHRRVVEKAVATAAVHSPFPECRLVALNVVCCETAICLKSGAKRKCQARAQSVANDPCATSGKGNRARAPSILHAQDHSCQADRGDDPRSASQMKK